jgi:large subunit ribosomal protein L25
MSKPVQVSIPVNTIGTPVGVVEDGGQLQVYQYDLNIESLPDKVPHSIDIDVSELKIGDNIMVEELKAPEGVEILFEDNFAVVGVTTMAELPEEIEEGEEVEAEEGAEAPEVEGEGEAEAEA